MRTRSNGSVTDLQRRGGGSYVRIRKFAPAAREGGSHVVREQCGDEASSPDKMSNH